MDFAFQVDLRGVVDLLSQHLYSGPDVFVCELLQNAVDALTAAGVHDVIRVDVDRAPGETWVHVEDRGIGLTTAQVHEFLSTIGSSSKRDLLLGPRVDFLGRFGIGLLSCFMVSDEVSLVTRSRNGDAAVRWVGRSDGSYRLDESVDRAEPGTRVSLRIRPDMAEVVGPGRVRELVARYGGLLPYRIEVHDDGPPVSLGGGELPWVAAAPDREQLLAVGRDLLDEDALDVVPLSLPAAGLTGAAYVLKSSPSPQARQRHRVYLKRMLLAANVDGLAPDWAFFVRVVIDSDSLRPLASREGLYEDETLAIVREAIGDAVRSWLVTLADHEPERLQELVRVHALALKALAVHDDELLALFARWLPLETSMGRMTILEAATRSSSHVRYAESLDTFRQLVQVAAAQGLLLVNGGYTYDTELLARLPAVLPGVTTEAITPADLLADLNDVSNADWPAASTLAARGTELLAGLDCAVTVRDFSPSSVPCLYLLGDAARFRRSAEEAVEMSGGFWGSLVSGVVGSSGPEPQAQLCLNFRNPLVRGLVGRPDPDLGTALEVLYLQAMLLGRHPLRGRELSLLSRSLTKLLESGSS